MENEVETLRKEVAKLKKLAYKDHLTGLLNRRGFEDSIQLAIDLYKNSVSDLTPRRGFIVKNLSLVVIDIDHFKQLNDKYGHPVGDLVIKNLAKQIKINSRKTDLIGRWGGEEIIIGLIGTELESAIEHANKLLLAINQSRFRPSYAFSAGVASMGSSILSFNELYKAADDALYIAKKSGRNRVEACKISTK